MKKMTKLFLCLVVLTIARHQVLRHSPKPPPQRQHPPPLPLLPLRLLPPSRSGGGEGPHARGLGQGRSGGTITGTINDVPVPPTKGLTLDVANQVGQNKIAAEFIWTLVTGYLVMFMQAGFAMVESGLTRVRMPITPT